MICFVLQFRLFGKYTMQVTMAVAFGRQVKIIKGMADELTESAEGVFLNYADSRFTQKLLVFGCKLSLLRE